MPAPYPIYKGMSPKPLVDETRAIVSGQKIPLLNSPTVFGNQMICIANYYLALEVRETGVNRGKYIDEFNREYSNNDDDFPKQAAWCSIFMWKIAEEAAKLQRCNNPLPQYNGGFINEKKESDMAWGNARNTVMYLQQRGIKFSKSIPVAGCMMFRNSKHSNSSGHWGIVTEVTKTKFRTIEGNVTLEDGGEGVGYWEYDINEIMNEPNGIIFAHVQENAGCGNEVLPFNGYSCQVKQDDEPKEIIVGLPKCIKKVNNGYVYLDKNGNAITNAIKADNGRWYAMGLKAGEGWVDVTNCSYEYTPPIVKNEEKDQGEVAIKDYSPVKDTKNPPAVKTEICRTKIITLPTSKQLQHYTALQDRNVISDILEATTSNDSLRNGSAIWYNNSTRLNPGTHTGFGMFRDKIGNLIYVLNMNQPQSKAIIEKGMVSLGAGANTLYAPLHAKYYSGDGFIERFREDILNRKFAFNNETPQEILKGGGLIMPPESGLNHEVNYRNLAEKNLYGFLKEIENKEKLLDRPIIILIGERAEPPKIIDVVVKALSVAKVMTTLVGVPIPTPVLKVTETLVTYGSDPKLILRNPLELVKNVTQLAEFFAPETTKGVISAGEDYLNGLSKNIQQASAGISKFVANNTQMLSGVLESGERFLGFDKGEVEKLFNRYKDDINSSQLSFDITKIVSNELDLTQINRTVENAQNMLMLDQMRRSLKSKELITGVISRGSAFEIPILQDLFASAGSNSVMATFPRIQEFTGSLLENDAIRALRGGENGAEITAGLISQAFGLIPADTDILRPLQLEALKIKALSFSKNGDPFVLPESVDPEYKECFEFVIAQETGAKVINCPTGWTWDKQLKKCVNPNAQSGWTNSNNSNSSNSTSSKVDTGGQVKKDTGKSGGGFDFGGGFDKIDISFDLLKKTGNPEIEIGKKLPDDYLPPCLVKEDGNFYFYPYGKPKVTPAPTEKIITQKPVEKVLTILSKDLPKESPFIIKEGGISTAISPNSSADLKPIQLDIPNGGVNAGVYGNEGLSMPLPTLADLPSKLRVYRKGSDWFTMIGGKEYKFDPITCELIGYKIDNEKTENNDVTKNELEQEIAKRKRAIEEAEKKAEELRRIREQQAEAEKRKIEAEKNREIENLRRELDEISRKNQEKEVVIKEVVKEVPNNSEVNRLIDELNKSRAKEKEAITQLNFERMKESDDSIYLRQIEEYKKSIDKEKARTTLLEQENLKLKSQPVTTPTIHQPAVVKNEVGEDCTDCDKLRLPKKVVQEIIYDYGTVPCDSCGDDDCDCEY